MVTKPTNSFLFSSKHAEKCGTRRKCGKGARARRKIDYIIGIGFGPKTVVSDKTRFSVVTNQYLSQFLFFFFFFITALSLRLFLKLKFHLYALNIKRVSPSRIYPHVRFVIIAVNYRVVKSAFMGQQKCRNVKLSNKSFSALLRPATIIHVSFFCDDRHFMVINDSEMFSELVCIFVLCF